MLLARTLRELEALEFDQVIPGHGRVRSGKQNLRLVAEMFESLVQQVQQAVAEGRSLEQTQQEMALERFREELVRDAAAERYWGHFIPEAVAKAFEEAGGAR